MAKKDNEGSSYTAYGPPSSFEAEVWPAGGRLQAEIYGQRVSRVMNCRIGDSYEVVIDEKGRVGYRVGEMIIREGDGVCLHVPGACEPDYRVAAIRPCRFLTLEVEQL